MECDRRGVFRAVIASLVITAIGLGANDHAEPERKRFALDTTLYPAAATIIDAPPPTTAGRR